VAAGGLSAAPAPVDLTGPWAAPFARWHLLLAQPDWRDALTRAAAERGVVTAGGQPVAFVDGADAGCTPYELHIHRTGRVPTRDNAHDRCNALVWLAYPRSKAQLNARQATVLARDGVGPTRGRVRDAATLLDESGLLLLTDDHDLVARLRARDWSVLRGAGRTHWGRACRPLLFGHALLARLAQPFAGLTAVVLDLNLKAADPTDPDRVDAVLAARLRDDPLHAAAWPRLPVLGIPGWWPGNADPAFYADAQVFRPARAATAARAASTCAVAGARLPSAGANA
jgi:hypothetical protein